MNNDGFEDVLIGVPGVDQVMLELGSASGLGATTTLGAAGKPGTRFGQSVCSAGDVNGDGFADVVIGAPNDETASGPADEGVAYLYIGRTGWRARPVPELVDSLGSPWRAPGRRRRRRGRHER